MRTLHHQRRGAETIQAQTGVPCLGHPQLHRQAAEVRSRHRVEPAASEKGASSSAHLRTCPTCEDQRETAPRRPLMAIKPLGSKGIPCDGTTRPGGRWVATLLPAIPLVTPRDGSRNPRGGSQCPRRGRHHQLYVGRTAGGSTITPSWCISSLVIRDCGPGHAGPPHLGWWSEAMPRCGGGQEGGPRVVGEPEDNPQVAGGKKLAPGRWGGNNQPPSQRGPRGQPPSQEK